MEKVKTSMILVLLICCATMGNSAKAGYVTGVKSGDTINYNITVTSNIAGMGQSFSGSIKITVQSVQGTEINGTIEISLLGYGTPASPISIDVATGSGTYAGFIIPANLTVGDTIPGENAQVENIVTHNGRKAILANATSPFGGFSGQVYWDQATGVLLETSGSAMEINFSITLAGTTLWSGGFIFEWWIWLIIIVVIAVVAALAFLIMRRRRPKAAQVSSEILPPPPPPPLGQTCLY
jgi:hypothetical protein